MRDKNFVREEWDSSKKANGFVRKEWDSSDRSSIQKRTAADRIRAQAAAFKQNLAERRAAVKAQRAYAKSPQGKAAAIRQIRQDYALESAKYRLAKAKSQRRSQQLKSFGLGNTGGLGSGSLGTSMGMGGMMSGQPSYSGFDSMFGFGSQQTPRKTKRMMQPKKSGFDEMFGF